MGAVKKIVAATVSSMIVASPVLAASPVRPGLVELPAATSAAPLKMGTRLNGRVAPKSNLLGAPLFLAFLGAVVITVGTILIVDNGSSSPQGS